MLKSKHTCAQDRHTVDADANSFIHCEHAKHIMNCNFFFGFSINSSHGELTQLIGMINQHIMDITFDNI